MPRLLLPLLLFPLLLSAGRPDDSVIYQRAETTRKRMQQLIFAWTAVHGNADRAHYEVDCLSDGDNSLLELFFCTDGDRIPVSSTLMKDGFWYVTELVGGEDRHRKYREYQAAYRMPTTYTYLLKSKPQF